MAPVKRKAEDALKRKPSAKQPRRPETLKNGMEIAGPVGVGEAEKGGGGRRHEVSKRAGAGKEIAAPAYLKSITDKKLKGQMVERERLFGEAALTVSKIQQWLLPSEAGYLEAEDLEDTRHFSQEAIVKEVDITSARKAFDLQLPALGPYTTDYNLNGRYLLLGGRKGHLAMMDWKKSRLLMEIQVRETIRDVKFLHNETFFCSSPEEKCLYL